MEQPAVTPAQTIATDFACRRCGYNLRGLRSDGVCPECGEAIAPSLRGELLRFADPSWLDRLAFGTSLQLWNIVIMIVAGLGAGILVSIGAPEILLDLLELVDGGVGLWACLAITAQEPRIALNEDPVTLRKVIRVCATLSLLGSAMSMADGTTGLGWSLCLLGAILSLCSIVSAFGELIYFRRFAARIPDAILAKSTRNLMWLLPICLGVVLVGSVFAGIVAAIGGGPSGAPGSSSAAVASLGIGFVACFGVLGLLVSLLWYVRLLTKYRSAFRNAAAESRNPLTLVEG